MINLLPPELKQAYRYSQRNTALIRWVVACFLALVGVGIIATYGLVKLHQSTTSYNASISQTQTYLARQKYDQVERQVGDISGSLKLAVQVLSKEVLFSQLLKQMTAAIPTNAILTGLTINNIQGGLDITADAADYKTATQVQVNLSNPANQIFSRADIESIACGGSNQSTGQTNTRYPCIVKIRALFAPDNPFLFINNGNKGVSP